MADYIWLTTNVARQLLPDPPLPTLKLVDKRARHPAAFTGIVYQSRRVRPPVGAKVNHCWQYRNFTCQS